MRALLALLRKEYRQIFRDRLLVAQLLVMPLVQLALLANAATFEVKTARLAVVDGDRSAASRGLVDRLQASGRFRVSSGPAGGYTAERADEALLRREVDAVLTLPRDFERDLVRGGAAPAQLALDAEDGAAAGVTQAYARRVVAAYAAELAETLPSSRGGAAADPAAEPRAARPLEVRTRGWYNPGLDYHDYMVPGILVQLVTLIGTMLTALNIVREKELGTLEQLNVTPVTPGQFITAKLVPLWSLALVALALGLAVARLAFDVPVRGSVALVFGSAAVYLVAALGVGLLISTVTETQQQAMFVTFFVVMIYLLMSGLFTPVTSMPPWAQALAQANPMLHYVGLMRAVLLKGAGPADVARPLGVLAAYGGAVLALAVARYRKASA
jgi:ABC-2 type transport system permease protein